MTLSIDRMYALDARLRAEKQVLVLITDDTQWERPQTMLNHQPPTRGYALASHNMFTSRHEKKAYVTDVNHDDRWRELHGVYDSLEAVADGLRV